ncbi:MAG TPA: hypothetical protein VMB71_14910 [Acetobacteraceae bacterium]|nr:hypothetical protein [Acetobacteraceae bacterium]
MITRVLMLAGATLAASLALCSVAAAAPGEVQQRLNNQQQRIDRGVANGRLTHGEAARDESHDARMEAAKQRDRMEHGGHLTAAEHARLNDRENNNSQRIYDKKHNDVTAPPR